MPKVTYSASRGIVQSNGQGFFIQDVPISPSSEAIADGNAVGDLSGLGVVTFTSNSDDITLEDGVAVGQQKVIIVTTGGTNSSFTDSQGSAITGINGQVLSSGDAFLCIWTGSTWKLLS